MAQAKGGDEHESAPSGETGSTESQAGVDANESSRAGVASAAGTSPAGKRRSWSGLGNRAMPALVPWLVAVTVCYVFALKAPDPGLPGPVDWLLSPIESNPFRACHAEAPAGSTASEPPAKASGLLVRESFAQENAPVEQIAPSKGDVPNAAAEPQQQQQQQQQQIPVQQEQQQAAVLPSGAVTGCDAQGFGDLIDAVMDRSGRMAWAINAHGQIYRTDDGGKSWERQDPPEFAERDLLTTIAATDDGTSLIIAARTGEGFFRFYRSDDRGDTWRVDPAMEFSASFGNTSRVIPDEIIGLGLSPNGRYVLVLIANDAAAREPEIWHDDTQSWEIGYGGVEPGMIHGLRTHNFGNTSIPVNASGATKPPIISWERGYQDPALRLVRVEIDAKDPKQGLIDKPQRSFTVNVDLLRAIAASDSGEDVFIAEPTAILHGNARGEPWSRIDLAALAPAKDFALAGIDIANGSNAIMAVGTNALFASHDGGKTFFEPPLGRAPAPWYYLILLAGPIFVFYVLRPRKPETITIKGDTSNALSDRALGLNDADALNLRRYAQGIADLLRNESTRPPLVVGVTGPWGSGKSSVMQILSDLLDQHEMPTVWFNAWHHQSENHLLASLLSNIRDQGIPSVWTRPGRRLRWRLLMRRLSDPDPIGPFLWVWFMLLVAALLVPGGLLLWAANSLNLVPILGETDKFTWAGLSAFVTNQFCNPDTKCDELVEAVAGVLPNGRLGAIIAFLISLLSLDRLGRVALITRGFDPGKLMTSMMPAKRNPNLDEQLSFRHRFGEELKSTVAALAPYRLVIFIDDLDRCRPENVVDVLEAVNFVVSEADCYVVIGMDRLYVLRGIRQQFEKFISMETAERKSGISLEEDKGRPADFAEHYLEKLINVFVAVPKMGDAARQKLMAQMTGEPGHAPESARPKLNWANWLRRAAAVFVIASVVLTPTLVLIGRIPTEINEAAKIQKPAEGPKKGQTTTLGEAKTEQPSAANTAPTDQAGGEPAPIPIDPTVADATVERSQEVPSVDVAGLIGFGVIAAAVAATIILAAIRALAVPPDLLVRDSSAFRSEMSKAEKRLANYLTTPRRAKRFVNRLRLFASVLKSTDDRARTLDSAELDRATVTAGALHTLGRELFLAGRNVGAEPPADRVEERRQWMATRDKAIEVQKAIREPMITFYRQAASDLGPERMAQVDQLYWKFWELVDGVALGDGMIVDTMRDANILVARPPRPDGPAVDGAPSAAPVVDIAAQRTGLSA
ncbi:MAG: P-loop NTPase fold protein [Dongiaceae bacterium]